MGAAGGRRESAGRTEAGTARPAGRRTGRPSARRGARLGVAALVVALLAALLAVTPGGAGATTGPADTASGAGATPAAPVPDLPVANAAGDPTCTLGDGPLGSDTLVTCTFAFAGAVRSFEVPPGVDQIRAVVTGAGGGSGIGPNGRSGGSGATIVATVPIGATRQLAVSVGGAGGSSTAGGGSPGWPDGGAGGVSSDNQNGGCGGGGRSSIEIGGAPMVVGGGGGGCGGYPLPFAGGRGGDASVYDPSIQICVLPGICFPTGPLSGTSGTGATGLLCDTSGVNNHGFAGQGGYGAGPTGGGGRGEQGMYLFGAECRAGQIYSAGAGQLLAGGAGGRAEHDGAGGGGGGGGGWYGGGGGGGGNRPPGSVGSVGGGGGGGGGLSEHAAGSGVVRLSHGSAGNAGSNGSVVISFDLPVVTTTVTSSAPQVEAGTPVTFTATVDAGGGLLDGAVSFVRVGSPDQPLVCADPPVTPPPGPGPWTVTCTTTPTTAGPLTVRAEKAGRGTAPAFSAASISAPTTVTVTPATTTTGLEWQPTDRTAVATVTGAVGIDGTVSFSDGGIPLPGCSGLAPLDPSQTSVAVSCPIAVQIGSTYELSVVYTPGPSTLASSATLAPFTVERVGTTTSLSTTGGPFTYGQPVTVTATVTPDSAAALDGVVSFSDEASPGAPVCASVPVDPQTGTASCTLALAAGGHRFTAAYRNGSQTGDSDGGPLDVDVAVASPTLALAAAPAGGQVAGQPVTLAATVSLPTGGQLGEGVVTFRDGAAVIAVCSSVAVVAGAASCTFTPGPGSSLRDLSASYTGTTNADDAGPAVIAGYRIDKVPTQVTVTADPGPVAAGAAVVVTATVASVPAGGTPTGAVTFRDNGQLAACTGAGEANPAPLVAGSATCTVVPSAGIDHTLAAAYGGDLTHVSSAASAVVAVGRFASTTAVDVSPADPAFGQAVTVTATISSAGPVDGATVAFTDGATPIAACAAVPVSGGTASCTVTPAVGAHTYAAAFAGSTETEGSSGTAAEVTVAPVTATATAVLQPTADDQLTATVTVLATVTPTGAATFTLDGQAAPCGAVGLTAGSTPGSAVATCTWTSTDLLLTAHDVEVALALDAAFVNPPPAVATYTPAVACAGGFASLWSSLAADPTDHVVSGPAGAVTATVTSPSPMGACNPNRPIAVTATADLFDGALRSAAGSSVTGTVTATDGLCLTAGELVVPATWTGIAPLAIVSPVCFDLTSGGGLGGVTGGQLGSTGAPGTFPLLDVGAGIVGSAAASTAVGFDAGAGTMLLRATVGAGATPDLELVLRVTAGGAVTGTATAPGVSILGQPLTALAVTVGDSVAGPLTFTGSTTVGPVALAPGLVLRGLVVTLDAAGFHVAGTASVGAAGAPADLAAAGRYRGADDWRLDVTGDPSATWTPLPGLELPEPSGTIEPGPSGARWSVAADRGSGPALATWRPTAGLDLAVVFDRIELDDDPACAGLAVTGTVELAGVTLPVTGCVDLATGAFRIVEAPGAVTAPDGISLAGVDLDLVRGADGTVTIAGGATATFATGSGPLVVAATFGFVAGTFVLGGPADLGPVGFPGSTGYVAYSGGDVLGLDTGVPGIGVVDLPAGTTAVGSWTPSRANGTAATLEDAGFVLPTGDTIRFDAALDPSQPVDFVARLATPAAMPFVALPDGAPVDHAVLRSRAAGLQIDAAASVQRPRDVALLVTLDPGAGSFDGTASVTDLVVFGVPWTFDGLLAGRRGPLGLAIGTSVTTTRPGPFTPPSLRDVEWTDVALTLGPGGFEAEGTMAAGGRSGLRFEGSMPTSLSEWSFTVTSDELTVAWTPTDGVDTKAAFAGAMTSSRPSPGAAPAITFDVAATTDIPFQPDGDTAVLVQLTRMRLSNLATRPATCTVAASNGVWLALDGRLNATLGETNAEAGATGCLDRSSGALKIVATLTSLRYTDTTVTVSSPVITVRRQFVPSQTPAGGSIVTTITAEVDLAVVMPDGTVLNLNADLQFVSGAFAIGVNVDLSPWIPNAGASASLYYASKDVTIDAASLGTSSSLGKLRLKKGVNFAFRVTLDPSVADKVGEAGGGTPGSAMLTAIGRYEQESQAFSFELRFRLDFGGDGSKLFETDDGVALYLDEGYIKMTVTTTSIAFGIGLTTTLHVPPATPEARSAGQPGQDLRLVGELTISDSAFSVSLQLGDCNSAAGSWRDAFGVAGLTVQCAAVQGGVSYAGVPSVGLVGKITSLPQDVADTIGYVNGSPMTFAFNLEPFVLSIELGTKNSGQVALRPLAFAGAPDLIEVDYASLYIAPRAATIGQTTFAAGYGIGFQATVHGVRFDILGRMDPSAPLIDVRATMSRIQVGALGLGPVEIDLKGSKTGFSFSLDATLALGPASAEIGPSIRISGELAASVHIDIGLTGLSAYLDGYARGNLAALLAQSTCFYGGVAPYPCDWEWRSTSFDLTLERFGFSVDGSGITVSALGYELTLPWKAVVSQGAPPPPDPGAALAAGGVPARPVAAVGAPRASLASTAAPAATQQVDEDPTIGPDDIVPPQPIDEVPAPTELIPGEVVVAPPAGGGDENLREPGDETVLPLDETALPPVADGRTTGSWRPTGSLQLARTGAAVATLADGGVLVAGGAGPDGAVTPTAEVYDPVAGTWRAVAPMASPRVGATASLLPDGRVLVAGGSTGSELLASTELFDPASGSWTAGPSLAQGRRFAASAVLADGSVLVAGGLDGARDGGTPLGSTEVYDPIAATWRTVGPLATPRAFGAIARLADGSVLLAGGAGAGGPVADVERFDPATGSWRAAAPLPEPRQFDTATVLVDGRVLVAGSGANGAVYDPGADTWTPTGAMSSVRAQAVAGRLPDGTVLVAGGAVGDAPQLSAEVYDPSTNRWTLTPDPPVATMGAAVAVLANGSVLVGGGTDGTGALVASMIYEPAGTAAPVPPPPAAVQQPVAAPAAPTAPSAERLIDTGTNVIVPLTIALALLLLGGALVVTTRRRSMG